MKVWSNIKIAVRVALRMDMNPARDDWHDLYDRIRSLMAAYTASVSDTVAGLFVDLIKADFLSLAARGKQSNRTRDK